MFTRSLFQLKEKGVFLRISSKTTTKENTALHISVNCVVTPNLDGVTTLGSKVHWVTRPSPVTRRSRKNSTESHISRTLKHHKNFLQCIAIRHVLIIRINLSELSHMAGDQGRTSYATVVKFSSFYL